MNNQAFQSFFNAPDVGLIVASALASVVTFLPRLILALIIFFVSRMVANYIANVVAKILAAINLRRFIGSFQLGIDLSKETETGIDQAVAVLVRYIVLYIGLIFTLQILGLIGIANFLIGLVGVLPRIASALVILFIGVLLAGLIESVVKKALITFGPATARLGGKIASYTVVSFFGLMGLAELGLAATFINTLFIGLVAALSLAFGLAIGLGSKDVVSDILQNWYDRRQHNKPTKK